MGKNKALAYHTSTYFHTRRVSIKLSCFRSPTLAGAPFGSHRRYSVSCPYQWSPLQPRQHSKKIYLLLFVIGGVGDTRSNLSCEIRGTCCLVVAFFCVCGFRCCCGGYRGCCYCFLPWRLLSRRYRVPS